MQNSKSFLVTLAVFLFTVIFFFNKQILASENFYIEIGQPEDMEEINSKWEYISKKYKSSVGHLTLYPKKVIKNGEQKNVIQAGPIKNKNEALRICDRLFTRQTPCFVIEGIETEPPSVSVGISQATVSSSSISSFFTWSDSDNSQGNTVEGQVDVAQAIPVPLSGDNESKIEISENQPIDFTDKTYPQSGENSVEVNTDNIESIKVTGKVFRGRMRKTPEAVFTHEGSGNLVIGKFPTTSAANKFWGYVNDQMPELTEGLNVGVQKPLTRGSERGIRIRIGKFSSGTEAANFCNQTTSGIDDVLKCRYEIDAPPSFASISEDPFEHSNRYEERRRLIERRLPEAQNDTQRPDPFAPKYENKQGQFWIQVAISDSKGEAERRWKEIKDRNSSLLKGVSGNVISPSSAIARYAVLLGAFASESESDEICDKLLLNGVDCLVISQSKP